MKKSIVLIAGLSVTLISLSMAGPTTVAHSVISSLQGRNKILKPSAKQFMNRFLIFHEYAITPRAIKRCLGDMGFVDIRVFNAHLTGGNFCPAGWTFAKLTRKILSSLTWGFFKTLEKLSGGRWLWGPSLQVIARKGTGRASKT